MDQQQALAAVAPTPASNDPTAQTAHDLPSTASDNGSSSDEVALSRQPPAAGDHPAADQDWWRCPISSKVMRDLVLLRSEGHSFEREAQEE